ncbi:MAG: hypothetical protein ACT4O2_05420 [Beijerinckiaceae bacterium]
MFLLAQVAAPCGSAAADPQSPDFGLPYNSADGDIIVEANGATLGEILDRLFTERGILVDWRDQDMAGKVIQGSFRGSIDEVTQRLLAGVKYFAFSSSSEGEVHIPRLVIFGGASSTWAAPQRPVAARARAIPRKSPGVPFIASRARMRLHR